ncbi:MAG: hypothetical protein NTZ98_21140 [Acidobacteria bacterium]|jgi:hypothetical protein|nr:hypothetical protein [Acidobacteriota bacterium]
MTIHLTPQAEQVLRELMARQPDRRPEELVEAALNSIARQPAPKRGLHGLSEEDFETWFEAMAAYSDRIPPMAGETFSREMIYRDRAQ